MFLFCPQLDPEEEKRLKAEADQARKETERRAAAEFLMALKHAHSQGHIAVEERNWFKVPSSSIHTQVGPQPANHCHHHHRGLPGRAGDQEG